MTPLCWRTMWVLALFDLPTQSKKQRCAYSVFRKDLLESGFTMMQYSVHQRHCSSPENAQAHIARMCRRLPPEGEVRFITITDKLFEHIRIFWGKQRIPSEKTSDQLTFLSQKGVFSGQFNVLCKA